MAYVALGYLVVLVVGTALRCALMLVVSRPEKRTYEQIKDLKW